MQNKKKKYLIGIIGSFPADLRRAKAKIWPFSFALICLLSRFFFTYPSSDAVLYLSFNTSNQFRLNA